MNMISFPDISDRKLGLLLMFLSGACIPFGLAFGSEIPGPVSEEQKEEFLARGYVSYADFGAVGDGKTDALGAIVATHRFANRHHLPVRAEDEAVYYIGGRAWTAVIQTDTDFGHAAFLIDDRNVEDRNTPVFRVTSNHERFPLNGVTTLRRGQETLPISLPGPHLVTVTDSQVRRYIRFGPNQNDGQPQTDIFLVDGDGRVNGNAPIIWDFDTITEIHARRLDETPLTLTGGVFTTIANQEQVDFQYFSRGIVIERSRVAVNRMVHQITGEGEQGAPYRGFLHIRDSAYVTVSAGVFTGRKTFWKIGSAGVPVPMGSYGLTVNRAINVSFINCAQSNDLDDPTYWGIMASNYSKNLVFDGCKFSRFDAHMGVANATIRNSVLGHQGINAIGSGTFLVENTTVRARHVINLRRDYGSTWRGEFVLRNVVFVPEGGQPARPTLFGGYNSGRHDFGYPCTMPETIRIEGLEIRDANHPEDYRGPAIFADFNPKRTDASYEEIHPYSITSKVVLKDIKTSSGLSLRLSNNPFMFSGVQVVRE